MITLLMTSRTGSSMVARIFAAHGLRHDGNINCEHQGIRSWINVRWKQVHQDPRPIPYAFTPSFQEYLNALDIDMWKGDAFFWPLWDAGEVPSIVCIRRNLNAAARSLCAKNASAQGDVKNVRRLQQMRYDYMDELIALHGGVNVYTDELIEGDYSSLKKAFDYCNIEFKPGVATRLINPNLWHFR